MLASGESAAPVPDIQFCYPERVRGFAINRANTAISARGLSVASEAPGVALRGESNDVGSTFAVHGSSLPGNEPIVHYCDEAIA
jgi:hypothetical protein